jgi:hypothetical protein
LKVSTEFLFKKIKRAIFKIKKINVSDLNEISNKVIYFIIYISPAIIMRLFQAYINQRVHLKIFKKTIIMIIRKDGDRDYLNPEIYRLIALLNILKKALKAVISNYIYFLAETHTLLSNT